MGLLRYRTGSRYGRYRSIEEGKNHTESMQSVRSYLLFLLGVLVVQGLRYSDFVKDYKVIDENYHFYDEIEMKMKSKDDDDGLTMTELVQKRGYTINTHYVTTADGYILTIFNIPEGKENKTTTKKPVVLLQHGLFDSSYTWINNYETQSLGYILADNGYDVWFGNNRGTNLCMQTNTLYLLYFFRKYIWS